MIKKIYPLIFSAILFLQFTAHTQTYQYYYGNIHAHSSYSDGNKGASSTSYSTPGDDYNFAKQSYNFNFLGISEHNHSQAGMQLADYAKGLTMQIQPIEMVNLFVCMELNMG